jgi:hypothetical protein
MANNNNFTTRENARKLACLIMRHLTIYPGDLESLTDPLNHPDTAILTAVTDLIEGFDPAKSFDPGEPDEGEIAAYMGRAEA